MPNYWEAPQEDTRGRELARRRTNLELAAQRRPCEESDRLLAEAIAYEETTQLEYNQANQLEYNQDDLTNQNTTQNTQHDQVSQYSQYELDNYNTTHNTQYNQYDNTNQNTTNASFHHEPNTNNRNVTVNQYNYVDNRGQVTNNTYNNHSGNHGSYNTGSNNTTLRQHASNHTGRNTTTHHPAAAAPAISPPAATRASDPRAAPPSKQVYSVREAVPGKREPKPPANFLYPGSAAAGKKQKQTTWSKDCDGHCRVDKCSGRAMYSIINATTQESIFCSDHTCRSSGAGRKGKICRVPKHPWDRRCSDCMERGVLE